MSTIFGSSIDVGERLQVVRSLNRQKCEAALANQANERLQATVVKALQSRLRKLSKTETSEFQQLLDTAKKKGWKTPQNTAVGESAWINYWRACEEYERHPDGGRPVVPHRSGGVAS